MQYISKLSILLVMLSTTVFAYDLINPIMPGRSYWCNNGSVEYAVTVNSDASQAIIATNKSETILLPRTYDGSDIVSFMSTEYGGVTLSIWPNKQLSIVRFAKGNTDNMVFQCK